MLKGMRFRIYPNKEQQNLIARTLGCTRVVYNNGLSVCNSAYKEEKKSMSYYDLCNWLTDFKKDENHLWLKEVDSTALQQALKDLNKARKNFFEKRASAPKYKHKHDSRQSYRTQNNKGSIAVVGKYIKLPKLGYVKAKISMAVDGKINNATIERTPTGKYFCVLNVEVKNTPCANDGCVVGIDVGIKHFYSDSNGEVVENPKYLAKSEKKLKKEQRKLSRMIESHIIDYRIIKGYKHPVYDKPLSECSNIQKQRKIVARLHEKIANQRNDFLQKQSTILVKENQIICIEDLNVKGMVKNHRLAKSISDVSWSRFFNMLDYKSAMYGTDIVRVPRFYASSQTCNCCGYKNIKVKNLNIREWTCPVCGAYHDRDKNAANNILEKGLTMLAPA